MARYIMLLNWTEQGIKGAKETVKRARAAAAALEKAGAKLVQGFWTLGQYDLVLIVEAPNDETITALGLQIGMLGNVRSCTLRAFDEKEMEQILKKL
jgi:uncharacterized protein with GYD domain